MTSRILIVTVNTLHLISVGQSRAEERLGQTVDHGGQTNRRAIAKFYPQLEKVFRKILQDYPEFRRFGDVDGKIRHPSFRRTVNVFAQLRILAILAEG